VYAIAELFYTLQGEGANAGMAAQFIRFAGCNLWSGRDEHRERDADRHAAACPSFCDTNFAAKAKLSAAELVEQLDAPDAVPLIVLTGGEPLLQLDAELVAALRARFPGAKLAIETNGTIASPILELLDWVCVSPKVAPGQLAVVTGDEIKVVWPSYSPADYEAIAAGFAHRWVSAEAISFAVGRSVLDRDNLVGAAAWVRAHPHWRLTIQTHKVIGIR
jgi:7-carboxy-7-deazaguanine synthase